MKSDADSTARTPATSFTRLPIAPGTTVRLLLRSGTSVKGKFVSQGYLPNAVYAARYAAWRSSSSDAAGFPAIGDTVALVRRDGRVASGRFEGFGWEHVLVKPSGNAAGEPATYADLSALVGASGDTLTAARLGELDGLPRVDTLRLKMGTDTTQVALDDIAVVQVSHLAPLLVMAGMSAAVVLVILAANSEGCQSWVKGSDSGHSPPGPARRQAAPVGGP